MMPMVSVIVPVYNVEKYLDKCLASIVNQSYKELEILIMEGQSTDQSLKICRKWEKLDSRIKVISRKDGGLGPARNYGIKISRGEFIFFVDSDDYLNNNAIKILMEKMDENIVDVVAGGYKVVSEKDYDKQEYFLPIKLGCDEIIQDIKSRKRYIRRGSVTMWGKLYRTSFIKKKYIEMPAGVAEDLAVFPIIAYSARKIKCVDEIVYFYSERQDSVSNNTLLTFSMYKVIDIYCNYFKKIDEFEEYKSELFFLSRKHLTDWLNLFKKQLLIEDYREIEKKYIEKLDEFFGKDSLKRYTTIFPIGSYNIRFESKQIQRFEATKRHNPFTSTLSQFYNDIISNGSFFHKNQFRNKCLINDKEKIVKKYLSNPQFMFNEIIFDFMDDVNGIICLSDKSIISNTEVFQESNITGVKVKKVVLIDDEVYWKMWEKSCLNFIHYIEQSACKIILVKNRYTTKYEDESGMHDFENKEFIDKKNLYIEKMEKYFLENCNQKVYVVDIDEKYIYSDKYFIYGCSEKYLSMSGRIDVAEKIINIINAV